MPNTESMFLISSEILITEKKIRVDFHESNEKCENLGVLQKNTGSFFNLPRNLYIFFVVDINLSEKY